MATLQIILLIAAGVLAFAWLVYALTGPRPNPGAGVHVLRYGSALRTAALVLALAPLLVMAWCVWMLPWKTTTSLGIAGAAYLLASFIAGLLLLEVEGVHYTLNDEGVTRFSRWARPITVKWSDIERIGYSVLHRSFIIAAGDRSMKISRYLVGISGFVEQVRQRLRRERWANAAAAMDAIE